MKPKYDRTDTKPEPIISFRTRAGMKEFRKCEEMSGIEFKKYFIRCWGYLNKKYGGDNNG